MHLQGAHTEGQGGIDPRLRFPFVVTSVAIRGDGKRLISGGEDGTIRVWDADTGVEKLTLKGHTGTVTSVAISGDGKRILSADDDGTIRVWDAERDSIEQRRSTK
jgi:WD40 repeat protein